MISYHRNADIIEIIIRDFSGAKIESWKFNCTDRIKASNVFNLLKVKYGFEPAIKPDEHIDSDIDWLRKSE